MRISLSLAISLFAIPQEGCQARSDWQPSQPSGFRHPCLRSVWSVAQRGVGSDGVVQVGYKTPIKPAFEKCSTAGTHGMGSRGAFKSKRDAVAVRFSVACETN